VSFSWAYFGSPVQYGTEELCQSSTNWYFVIVIIFYLFSFLVQVNSHNITLSAPFFSCFQFWSSNSKIVWVLGTRFVRGQWWPHHCYSHHPLVLLYSAEGLIEFPLLLHFTHLSLRWRASECELLGRKRRKLKTLHGHPLHLRKLRRSMALKLDFGRYPFLFLLYFGLSRSLRLLQDSSFVNPRFLVFGWFLVCVIVDKLLFFLGFNAKCVLVPTQLNMLQKRSAIWIELRESQKYNRRMCHDMILLLIFSDKETETLQRNSFKTVRQKGLVLVVKMNSGCLLYCLNYKRCAIWSIF